MLFILLPYIDHITIVDWKATIGNDIAIDNIAFKSCNPNAAPPAVNCTFENGLCGWIQDPYDQFDWIRNNGSTASRNTGPVNDHTKGDNSGKNLLLNWLHLIKDCSSQFYMR